MHTLQSSNPGNRGEELPLLPFVAQEILAIPALSAGAKSIFSAMNTIVTKTRCRLKQNNIGPLVESSLRFKQDRRQKERITAQEGLPPFGSFHIDLLEVDDANDGADIDDNVSEISATSSLPLSDISDLDEFPNLKRIIVLQQRRIISRSTRNRIL
jgi:hypothetical protein